MLNIKYLTENREDIIEKLKVKNFDAHSLVDKVTAQYEERRSLQNMADQVKADMNKLSKEIGQLYKEGKREEAEQAKQRTAELKDEIKESDLKLADIDQNLQNALIEIPNIPHESVPSGKSEQDNETVKEAGKLPELGNTAMPHWELADKYKLIDFETGVKITGAGFPLYTGKGAKLQRALINFFLDRAEKAGYTEYLPPIMVNADSAYGTGQLPDKEGQMYHVGVDNLYPVPTAEVPVTNIFRNSILDTKDFPVKCCAYTPCFRREAGSYGKDVRGLNRLHQFDKVEIVRIEHPDNSYKALDEMVSYVASLVEELEIPYRIVRLCGGDLSFTSALTYDFEVYAAGQKRWLEVSSVSNFIDFQANRLKLRFREEGKKQTQAAHTLNGSALALPRIVAALLENNQGPEGICIPKALQEFTGFERIG